LLQPFYGTASYQKQLSSILYCNFLLLNNNVYSMEFTFIVSTYFEVTSLAQFTILAHTKLFMHPVFSATGV